MFNFPSYNGYTPWYSQPVQQQQNGIQWVQGIEAAKSYAVAPGQSALLMDSESNTFYIKSCDQSGMPMPLRIFDYAERITVKNETTQSDFVTRTEFEKALAEIRDGKHTVSAVQPEQ